MRLHLASVYTESIVFPGFKLLLAALIVYGITYFTHPAFWATGCRNYYVAGAMLLVLAALHIASRGGRAKYLPENASAPSDFAGRPLNARPYAGKVAVITGVRPGGIGFETVKSLSFLGAHVVMVDTLEEKQMDEAANALRAADKHASVALVRLDLSKLDDIASAAWEIVKAACKLRGMPLPTKRLAEHPCIDFLVNNAGYGGMKRTWVGAFERSFVVNYLGHYVLSEWLLPYIVNNTGRIINVGSWAHTWFENPPTSLNPQARVVRLLADAQDQQLVVDPWLAYSTGKFCNLIHASVLAKRLASRGIVTASLNPGPVNTNIWSVVPYPAKYILDVYMFLLFKTPYQGHQTTLNCITSGNIISGQFYSDCKATRARPEALDEKNWAAIDEWTRQQVAAWLPK